MGLFSILPANLSFVETWVARIFILLGILTIGPWACFLVYDLLLYIWRSVTYEIPVVGGRARGRQRPRAPSLTERPSGHKRSFSLSVTGGPAKGIESLDGIRKRNASAHGPDESIENNISEGE
ncbi:MAG: hypothetical protein M1824_005113 [Vezdaea acicularis]|nr:MAG: hypothetical protein M1824_005113 [Vezdaea acicularis]